MAELDAPSEPGYAAQPLPPASAGRQPRGGRVGAAGVEQRSSEGQCVIGLVVLKEWSVPSVARRGPQSVLKVFCIRLFRQTVKEHHGSVGRAAAAAAGGIHPSSPMHTDPSTHPCYSCACRGRSGQPSYQLCGPAVRGVQGVCVRTRQQAAAAATTAGGGKPEHAGGRRQHMHDTQCGSRASWGCCVQARGQRRHCGAAWHARHCSTSKPCCAAAPGHPF